MNKFFALLLFSFFHHISFAQQDVYLIDYTVSITDSVKTEIEELDELEGSTNNLFLSILQEMENQPVLQAWVGKYQNKIQSNLFEQWIQLTDTKNKTVFRLDAERLRYTKLNFDPENQYTNTIRLDSKENTVIAGFPCKLAIMEINSDENAEPSKIEIWYTEKIPAIVWGDYQYLSKVPGAALKISTGGIAFQAKEISKSTVANGYFEVPNNYTEVADLEYLNTDSFEDIELGEGIIAYFDSTEYLYGLKTQNGVIISEPKFSTINQFINGIAVATNEDNLSALVDKGGNNITDFIYEYISYDPELAAYQYSVDGKMSAMDEKGNPIWENSFEYFTPFNQDYSVASKTGQSGIIDKKGNLVIPMTNKLIIVNDNYYYITDEDKEFKAYEIKTNKFVISGFPYLYITNIENLFKVSEDGENFGLVNSKGEIILPLEYSYIEDFKDGFATAMKNNESEEVTIDSKGEIIKN